METPHYFDTHAHLNFEGFAENRLQLIQSLLSQSIWSVVPSSQKETSRMAQWLTTQFSQGIFAAVGQHPTHVDDEEFDMAYYQSLIDKGGVVAIGEAGLDSYRVAPQEVAGVLQRQSKLLEQHVELALKNDLPLIVHGRGPKEQPDEIYHQLFDQLKGYDKLRLVLHCYIGTKDALRPFLELGHMVSFTGIVTFKNAGHIAEAAAYAPMDRIMTETDSPYLSPEPVRGTTPNTPANLVRINEVIARLHGLEIERCNQLLVQNALSFFVEK